MREGLATLRVFCNLRMIQSLSMRKSNAYFSRPPSASITSPNLTKYSQGVSKTVRFNLNARVRDTGEMFLVPNCHHNMTIRELKSALELVVGIPADFQRLCYVDQGDLMEESTLHYNDIVPGTVLTVGVWPYNGWPELVTAAACGNTHMLKQVVSRPAPQCSSASSWLRHRLFSALFITAHRGHAPATRFLLQHGADVGAQTPRGRGALHAAAAQGHVQLIQELLLGGAPPTMEDCEGMTALSLAEGRGQKNSARQIFLFNWQQRAAAVRLRSHLDEEELFDHQRYNSHLKTWRCGSHGQRYMAHLGDKGRGEGLSGIGAGKIEGLDGKGEGQLDRHREGQRAKSEWRGSRMDKKGDGWSGKRGGKWGSD